MNLIKINNLTKYYNNIAAVDNINLKVNEGEILGFIGPNGAGKSTTIKLLLNFIFPTSGDAKIFDLDCIKDTTKIKENIGYVPSEVRYYDNMKVKELIKYAKTFHSNIDNDYVSELCTALNVELDKKINELSLGNKKKIAVVQALMHKPKLIILDEPTNGLDPLIQKKLFDALIQLKKEGSTIFLSSHNLTEVETFCDRVAIIKEGKIVEVKNVAEFVNKKIKKISLKISENIQKELLSLGAKNLETKNDYIVFNYDSDINKLLALISKHAVDDLMIEEIKLSEVFINYYSMEDGL